MRTKDEILNDAKSDIRNKSGNFPGSFWLRYRELEVQIDIRDIFSQALICLDRIGDSLENLK